MNNLLKMNNLINSKIILINSKIILINSKIILINTKKMYQTLKTL
jgi:hypothetical protein